MTLEHFDTVLSFVVILAGVSLLVTTLTQMVSALLGLRGTNLRWGIETLLTELDPTLASHAATISEKVLHHPLISDSTLSRFDVWLFKRWKLASAIRKEELIHVLHVLASTATVSPDGKQTDEWRTALAKGLDNLDPKAVDNLALVADDIKKHLPDDPAQAQQIINQITGSAELLSNSIQQWFDSTMDRVSQRFTSQTRIATVIFSVLVAFAMHMDAFRLLTRLSTDGELRARLAASADALSRKADELLVTSTNAPSAVYVAAMRQMIAAHPNELKDLKPAGGFADLTRAQDWLVAQLTAAHISDTNKWLTEYESLVPQAALTKAARDVNSILNDKLKLQIVPDPYPTPFYNYWTPSWLHFWGIAASAALLSLGAPFWFNVLKTLSNLRPVLAAKEQNETESANLGRHHVG